MNVTNKAEFWQSLARILFHLARHL